MVKYIPLWILEENWSLQVKFEWQYRHKIKSWYMYIPFLATIPILSTSGDHSCPGQKTEPGDKKQETHSIVQTATCTCVCILVTTTKVHFYYCSVAVAITKVTVCRNMYVCDHRVS